MNSSWNHFQYFAGQFLDNLSEKTDVLKSTYSFSTPWRLSGGMTFFIQKHGFITADAEWLNYSKANYSSSTDQDFSGTNKTIKSLYKSVINLRVGGEYRLDKYRFRAGYSLMPDPYQSEQNGVNNTLSSFTTGAGYRTDKFYVDLAVVFIQGFKSYRPYTVNSTGSPLVTLNSKATTIVFTVGFPF